ncbi:MAG: gamma-glutamyltransferase family protein [Allorhizobium sp.]
MEAVVTSPHRLTSEAGARVLRAGGTAIEAAIAMGAAISVVYPHFCGLGGDAVWLVADRDGRRACFMGIGQSARELPVFSGDIPLRGPLSALTSACVTDSWGHAHDYSSRHWGGTMAFADLLTDAITLAEKGFPVSRSQRFWLDFRKSEVAQWPGFAEIFLPGGKAPDTGDIFRQPALARSLRMIAKDGPRSFYEGKLAAQIAAGLEAAGSPLRATDLAATRTRDVEPASLTYRGVELLAPPPPTQGITTLAIMGILAHFDMASRVAGSTDHIHMVVEAVKRAFLDRGQIADPDFSAVSVKDLLSAEHLNSCALSIDPQKALAWPDVYKPADTVFFGATDAQGHTVSVLQSTYFDWGSGVVVGDTGILWQNRGAAFSLAEGHPNRLQPSKRPFYTLNPGLGLKDGKPVLAYGTQGADGQPQTLAMLLTRLIDHQQDAAMALRGPRFLLGRTFSDSSDNLKLEVDAGTETFAALQSRGHRLSAIDALSPLAGTAGVIIRNQDGSVDGAHDPRGDGVAIRIENVQSISI